MDNNSSLETLEEGFVESKTENPCNNIVEGANPDFLFNLSRKCTANGYSGHSEVNYDMELGKKISNGNIEEYYVIAGNNRINNETINSSINNKFSVLTNDNDTENNDVLDLEKDLNFGLNDEIENGTLSPSGENVNVMNEGEDIVGVEQCKFDVGDLVWVKTRSLLWWPGMISNPSNVAKDEIKSEKRGSFLVKYFGNSNFVWCPYSEMKPFLEYFESMSEQNNSRSFLGSVEKALCEFGRRVKSNITCPCSSKENSIQMTKTSKFDVSSSAQFESVKFYAFIKNVARSVSVPGKIELTVMKNHLSAFYCSLGHQELTLQQLRSSSDDDGDDKITSIKSTLSGKKLRKRVPEKPLKGRHVISKSDNINACSTELLSELCYMARDCFYLSRSKHSDSLRTFYHSFRIFAFLEGDIACKVADGHQSQKHEKRPAQISSESEEKMEGIGVTKESVKIESAIDNLHEKENVVLNKAKKKEQVILAGPESDSNSSITGLNITTDESGMISFQQMGSDVHKSGKPAEKRKVGPTPGLPHIETMDKLPNVSGNQPSFSFGDNSSNLNGINQMVFGSVSSLKDVQMAVQNMNNRDGINGTNQFPNAEFTSRNSESNMINNGLGPFIETGPFPSAGKPECKKQKRKESPFQADTIIPDLNRNVLENLPRGNYILSPIGKPELKSIRNKSANTETGSNVKPSRVFKKVEDPGGSLILSFAQDSTIPSKDTLVKTFSRFGLLKELQIQVLDDLTVQIVYERSSDASFASRSLEKSKPFGESIIGFKLEGVPAVTAPRPQKKRKYTQMAGPTVHVDATKNLAGPVKTPDIALMRQNVEMMKMSLDKAGNNISAELRAMLENEIKGFLDKISSMGGSSSSS